MERRSRGMERMWLFHEDIELLQSLREQVERVCRGDSRKCMPVEISGRTAKAVKLRIRTLRQQLKSDVLVLDAAYLRDQTIYKNAAKTATLADAVAAVAAAKMKQCYIPGSSSTAHSPGTLDSVYKLESLDRETRQQLDGSTPRHMQSASTASTATQQELDRLDRQGLDSASTAPRQRLDSASTAP